MRTKLIDLSDPKAVAAATDKQFPERPVPDGEASRAAAPGSSLRYKHACDRMTDEQFENSLRACADHDFSERPWVTERRYKE